ncbi:hypothetical protein AB4Z01_14920 [Inquilinus sp. YAF38]|uniref:hypothetical protein n=1 Tax=Inquilinus sp. YAF38 TaxID=3233084 RepID=UPI003F90EFCA
MTPAMASSRAASLPPLTQPARPRGAPVSIADIVHRAYDAEHGRKLFRLPTRDEFDATAWIAEARAAGIGLSIGLLEEMKFDLSGAAPGAFGGMMDVRVDLWGEAVKIELRREEADHRSGTGTCVHAPTREARHAPGVRAAADS